MDTLKVAYMLGCKLALANNANELAKILRGTEVPQKPELPEYNTMQNGEEKRESEAGASYGEKHQLAINPEWTGP